MFKSSVDAVTFTFNEERYIGELIDSIANQSHKVRKIIVCDDFSTDNTKRVILEKKIFYDGVIEIQLLENQKKGKVYAYELALNNVDSDYFFVCGGDDVVEQNYVSNMLNFLNNNSIDYAYANPIWCDEKLQPLRKIKKKNYYSFDDLLYANWTGGFLFGKSKILRNFLPFPEGLEFEDWYVGLLLAKKYEKSYVSDKVKYLYRRHENATTSVITKEKQISLIERDIRFYSFMLSMGVEEKFIKARKLSLRARLIKLNFDDFLYVIKARNFSIKEKLKVIYFQFYKKRLYKL